MRGLFSVVLHHPGRSVALNHASWFVMALYRYGYGRVSSADQSLERQIYLFEQIGVDDLYLEKVSGGRRDRPEFLRLVDDALNLRQEGHDVVIVVLDLTRWARDTAYSLDMLDRLEKAGIRVQEGNGQPVTLATAQGLLDVGVKSIFAHYFRLNLSDQAKKANTRKRAQGKPLSAAAPFGYQRKSDQSGLEPGPHWAIARKLVERFINEHCSLADLSQWLYKTHGVKRSPQGLSDWLQNPHIRGHIHYRQENRTLYNQHEPLITEGEFKEVQKRLNLNRQLRGKNKGRVHAVPSIVYCHSCGGRCSTSFNRRHRYFFCYRARRGDCSAPFQYCRQDWIEAAIQNEIQDAAEQLAKTVQPPQAISDPRILEKEDLISQLEPLAAFRPSIQDEINTIRQEIEEIKTASMTEAVDELEIQRLIGELKDAPPEAWDALTDLERRELYLDLCSRVHILGRDVVSVSLRL